MRTPLILTLLLSTISGLNACKDTSVSTLQISPIDVVATNYPLAYFASRIGKEHVKVEMPVPDGVNPAEWQPTPEEIGRIQQAEVILLNGAGYAEWAGRASLPSSKTWSTSNNARDEWIQVPDGAAHSHGPGGAHSHMKTASMTWMDPDLAIEQADSIREALESVAPEYQEEFASNYRVLRRQIIEASADIEQAINTRPEQPVFFSRPYYQYLSRRYHINSQSVDWAANQTPSDTQWLEFQRELGKHPATWMIWDSQPNPAIEERLKTLGISSVVYPTCANTPPSGDYLDGLSQSAASLRKVYGAEEPG